jgi:hypothetical protein
LIITLVILQGMHAGVPTQDFDGVRHFERGFGRFKPVGPEYASVSAQNIRAA